MSIMSFLHRRGFTLKPLQQIGRIDAQALPWSSQEAVARVGKARRGEGQSTPMAESRYVCFREIEPSQTLIVELAGALDEPSVSELRQAFSEILQRARKTVAVDMSRVTHVDSEGFGALLYLQKRLVENGQRLALIGCQDNVREALQLTRLEALLPHYTSLDLLLRN
jgi:anti-anti-sigma factor